MNIKILNKNRIDTSGSYVLSNIRAFSIDEGSTITENYNETLDSATIKVSNLTSKMEIDVLDKVALYDDVTSRLGTKYFVVDSFNETMVSVNPVLYNYEIQLVSETKLLEGVILPNLAITPLRSGTKRSVWYYLNQYLNLYCPQIRVYNSTEQTNEFKNEFYFNGSVQTRFNSIECPEMQWNTPTLREVLTDLMMIDDCIPVMKNNVISFIDLTEKQNNLRRITTNPAVYSNTATKNLGSTGVASITIKFSIGDRKITKVNQARVISGTATIVVDGFSEDTNEVYLTATGTAYASISVYVNVGSALIYNHIQDRVNYITQSKSSSDYCSEIKMTMQNVTQTGVPEMRNYVTKGEYIPFISDESVINSNNIYIKTQYPIYKIKHLYLLGFAYTNDYSETTFKVVKKDLCAISDSDISYSGTAETGTSSFVKEYDEYKTLAIDYRETPISGYTRKHASWYASRQNFTLYYNRGSNEIKGFNTDTKAVVWLSYNTLYWLDYLLNVTCSTLTQILNGYYMNFFYIEYETTSEQVFKASKDVYNDEKLNDRVIVDNQTNSFVDAYNQGIMEYQKANRLGNLNKMINARFTNAWDTLIKIGDYFDDDIIYQCQYQIYNNHIEVNATSCPNYILRDYYTGVKSKLRTWVNATNEALKRHELKKFYYEFSFNQCNEINDNVACGSNYFLRFLDSSNATADPVKFALVRTSKGDNYYPERIVENDEIIYQYYSLDFISRMIGNSLVFTCGFNDNYIVDYRPTNDEGGALTHADNDIIIDTTSGSEEISAPTINHSLTDDFKSVVITGVGTLGIGEDVKGKTIGGIPLEMYTYADENSNFEFDDISIMLVTNTDDNLLTFEDGGTITTTATGGADLFTKLEKILKKPLSTYSSTYMKLESGTLSLYKDNKEIPTLSMQYEFSTNSRLIYFTRYFVSLQEAVRISTAPTFVVYQVSSSKFVFGSLTKPSSATLSSVTYTIGAQEYIEFGDATHPLEEDTAYYIVVDGSSSVILAFVNEGTDTTKKIYLNRLAIRDKNVYRSQSSQYIYGTIISTN